MEQLRAWNLAAHAYTVLPPGHSRRAELRADYLAALSRHLRIKAELLPLVRAWRAAQLDVLLFKGFSLAEFVYPAAGARFHGDVDVLLRPEHVPDAFRIARDAGWRLQVDNVSPFRTPAHAAFVADSPGGALQLDAHHLAIASQLPWHRAQSRITRAVWERSREVAWEGTTVREMAPADAMLVGIVLARCWSGDGWRPKPADLLDMRLLMERGGCTLAALQERARELRCGKTLDLFLRRCSPWTGALDLARPSAHEVRRWNRAVFRERGPLGSAERLLRRVAEPWMLGYAAKGLQTLLRVRRALRREPDLVRLLASLTPADPPRTPGSVGKRHRLARGSRWAVRLLPTNPRGDCVARSLTVYHLLRSDGWPVVFVSGVRREGGRLDGHAWVELDGRPLVELGEPDVQRLYTVNFRYPDPGGASELQRPAPQHQPAPLQTRE